MHGGFDNWVQNFTLKSIGRESLRDMGVCGRIIIKCILEK
jgi:hypothetical protein